jgi:RNA polymerase sigma factor (sigma-70 family)
MVRKKKASPLVSGKVNKKMVPLDWDIGASPHEDLEAKELHEAVNKAVQHLKPSERRLFEMRQIEGLELDDIAKQTNIAKPSVKSIVSAARKKVFAEIKRLRT